MSDGDEPADDAAEQPTDESPDESDAADAPETESSNDDQRSGETAENEEVEEADDAETSEGAEEQNGDDATESDADTAEEGNDADDSNGGGDEASEEDELETRTPEALDERLDEVETDLEAAETESDLDAVEDDLEEVEADIEAADLPEPDEEDEDEEDAADPREELGSRVTELHEAIEDQRGPYAADAIEEIETAQSTITETRWTEQGENEVTTAVESFLESINDVLDTEFTADSDDEEDLVAALGDVSETIEERGFDPDEDEEIVSKLLDATDELTGDLDDAEEWDDLSVRQKLDVEGFYDVLTPETRKDFPPEWNAIKIYEKRNEPEPILRGLETFGSEFMQGHCIESLKRMGSPEAYDAMAQRAQKRNKPPIEVLGKIGDDRALDTLHEYIEGESDPALQKVTIKAIGEIGSTDSTQPVADRLVAENDTVRSNAARALGLIGDTRAIAPLSDVLSDDDSNPVRASAAWALNQIGTESALDAAREHADDRSFLVQTEAEKANEAMGDETVERPA